MNVWNSAFEIYSYSNSVPEVGYTPLEWMRHWVRALGRTILRAPAEPYRQECMLLIRNRLSGRKGERHVQS